VSQKKREREKSYEGTVSPVTFLLLGQPTRASLVLVRLSQSKRRQVLRAASGNVESHEKKKEATWKEEGGRRKRNEGE
jgi:hypothetical protein